MAGGGRFKTKQIQCPQCNHSIPKGRRCCQCGIRLGTRRRKIIKHALVSAGVLLSVSAYGLYLRSREIPVLTLQEIAPRFNHSTVRVRGRLKQDAKRFSDGTLYAVIVDEAGRLPVFVDGATNELSLVAGSQVEFCGTLHVGGLHDRRLRVSGLDHVVVHSVPDLSEARVSDISADQIGETVVVYGRVLRVWHPDAESSAPHRVVLGDGRAVLPVVYWLEGVQAVEVGSHVRVRGEVGQYRGELQLKLLTVEDLSVEAQ